MSKILMTALLCWILHIANAQYPGYKLLKEASIFESAFATAAQKTTSIKSDFIQEKNLSLLADKIVSKGEFWFRKENNVRMEYTSPFQYLMVINGNNVYIKDSQKETKISAKSNKLFQQINKIIIDCVNGKALQSNEFRSKIFEDNATYLAELSPVDKNLRTLFSHINLIIEKKDYAVSRIAMYEPGGDYTVIKFINRQLNTDLSDALFAGH